MYRPDTLTYRMTDSFFRYKLRFFLVVLGVTVVVGTALYTRTKSYVANASIRIVTNQQAADVMGTGNGYRGWTSPADQNIARFHDLMRDDLPGGFVDSALKNAGVKKLPGSDPAAADPRIAAIKQNIYTSGDSSEVFSLGLKWDNPGECADIVRALQQQYIEEIGLSKQAASIATAKFLDSEIANYAKRLEKAETALTNYKQTHAGQLPEAQTAEIEQLSLLKTELDYLKITSQDSHLRRAAIEARLKEVKPTSILEQTQTAAMREPSVAERQLTALQEKRSQLIVAGYLPTSQNVGLVDKDINKVQAAVNAEARARAKRAPRQVADAGLQTMPDGTVVETKIQDNPEFLSLEQQLTDVRISEQTQTSRMALLTQQIGQYEGRIAKLPAAERELTVKTRDYNILKKQHDDLLERREQAQIKANLEKVAAVSGLAAIGRVTAESTAGPKKVVIMMIGSLILGIIAGLCVVVLSEWLDPSLRYAADVERLMGVPVLAFLPESSGLIALPRTSGGSGGAKSLSAPSRFTRPALPASGPETAAASLAE